jgi:hypothetical protein
MTEKDLTYPLGPYPEVRELGALLERLEPGQVWRGINFSAHTAQETAKDPVRFYFRRRRDGVTLGFSLEEWQCLKALFNRVLAHPAMRKLFEELSLVYGEL